MYEDDKEESNDGFPLAALLGLMAGGAENRGDSPVTALMMQLVLKQQDQIIHALGLSLRAWIIEWAEQEYAKGNTSICSQEDFDTIQGFKNGNSGFLKGYTKHVNNKPRYIVSIAADIRRENEAHAKEKVTA